MKIPDSGYNFLIPINYTFIAGSDKDITNPGSDSELPKGGTNTKEIAINLTWGLDASKLHAGDIGLSYPDQFDKNMYIIADGQRLTKNGSRFNNFSSGTCLVDISAAENSKLPTTDNSLVVGRTYELSRPLLAQLTPNTWYKYTDAAGKQEILKTDEDGYLYKHDRLGNLLDVKGYESRKYSLGNAIRFTIDKDGKGYLGDNKNQATKPDSQDPDHKKDDNRSDNNGKKSIDQGDQSSTGNDALIVTSDANKGSSLSDSTTPKEVSGEGTQTPNKPDQEPDKPTSAPEPKAKATIKLIKKSYVYTKNGKLAKKNGK